MKQTAAQLMAELDKHGSPSDAEFLQRFFKTGPGQYGEGDIFIGLRVPMTRKIVANFRQLPLDQIKMVLHSPVHEHRLAALIIMANEATTAAKKHDEPRQKALYELYLASTDRINNWDLVDVSCRDVVGGYLMNRARQPLYKLAKSKDLWERRIAMVSTWQFIRINQLDDTFAIAVLLQADSHDLIHKAVGWMLREAGKKDEVALIDFLDKHATTMPRTALRYSLERLPKPVREHYMKLRPTGVK